ncbi:MAG TPA: DUF6318 family protein [Mycobacteriales bacterium]|nr:DUF6318 family protein [Mycobacteriales bacterium]
MPGGSSRYAATVAAAAAVGVFAAGCSDSAAGPVVLKSRTPLASPSAFPAPTFPATPEGAAAFARYFFQVLDEAYVSGDTTDLEVSIGSECESCARMLGAITRTYAEGQRYEGGRTTVAFAESPAAPGSTATVDVIYSSEELRRVDSRGETVSKEPAALKVEATLRLRWMGRHWVVTAYGIAR